MKRKTWEYGIIYLTGAVGYSLLEVLWRGRTHWTMMLTGGLCFLLIYVIDTSAPDAPWWEKCLAGSLTITLLEFFVGVVVNRILGWEVWDYSELWLNLLGQISLLYSVLWFLLCIPLCGVCRRIYRLFHTASIDAASIDAASVRGGETDQKETASP